MFCSRMKVQPVPCVFATGEFLDHQMTLWVCAWCARSVTKDVLKIARGIEFVQTILLTLIARLRFSPSD